MTAIINPGRANHPLRSVLRDKSKRIFFNGVEMADVLSAAVQRVAAKRNMRGGEVLEAVLTSLVSCVQAQVPTEEWDDVGRILADELRSRLTVTGDTGEDHYSRRMV